MSRKAKNARSQSSPSTAKPPAVAQHPRWRKYAWVVAALIVVAGVSFGTMRLVRQWQASRLPALPELSQQPVALAAHLRAADQQARRNPGSADAVGALGMAYESDNFYDNAAACYELAMQMNSADWRWHYYAAVLAEEMGDTSRVCAQLQEALKLNPNHAPGWYRLAEAHFKQGQYEQARQAYQRAIDADRRAGLRPDISGLPQSRTLPVAAYGVFGLARVAVENKQYDQANAMLDPLLREYSEFGPARRLLGRIYQETGQAQEAQVQVDLARKCAAYVPPADFMIDALARESCSTTFLLKLMSLANRARDNEWTVYLGRRTVEVDPGDVEAISLLARRLLEMGLPEEALPYANEYFKRMPNDYKAVAGIGYLLAQAGRPDAGEKLLLEALRANPQYSEAHTNYGVILRQRGQVDQAVKEYELAIQFDPDNADAHRNLGIVLVERGQLPQAQAHLEQAVRIKPTDEAAWGTLAAIALKQGQYDQAASLYRKALENSPSSLNLLNNLAWLLSTCPTDAVRNGGEALVLAQRACRLAGAENPSLLDTLAAAYAETGEFGKAVETASRGISAALGGKNQKQLQSLQQHQALYLQKKPWRDQV